jgi:putative transposase
MGRAIGPKGLVFNTETRSGVVEAVATNSPGRGAVFIETLNSVEIKAAAAAPALALFQKSGNFGPAGALVFNPIHQPQIMARTFTQMYLHVVFAVKGRQSLIPRPRKEDLHRFITGIVQKQKQKMLAVNARPDHTHLFIGFKPTLDIARLIQDVKAYSSGFINDERWLPYHFNWQDGYGAFTHSHNEVDRVIRYILNQDEHHRKQTFKDEYLALLKKFGIEYDEQHLFDWIEDV